MTLAARALLLELAEAFGHRAEVARLLEDKPDPEVPELGPLLRKTRWRSGRTMDEIKIGCAISRSQLSFYENGNHKNPDLLTLYKLATGYGVPLGAVVLASNHKLRLLRTVDNSQAAK